MPAGNRPRRAAGRLHGPCDLGPLRLHGLATPQPFRLRGPPGRGAPAQTLAAASIAASDFRTWLRSVVYQNSGIEARRKLP